MKLDFVHDALPGRVRFGAGARTHIPDEVELLGGHRVLLVSRRGSVEAVADELRDALGDRCAGWFDEVAVHVPGELAASAVARARELRADTLLCVGGGSAIGTTKMVALELDLPIVAVPTTYAGSEMTPIWGTTTDRRKRTGRDLRVLPRTVIYDPELTTALPSQVTGPSGMNALAHAIEALYAPNTTPVVQVLAREAIHALADGLPRAVADGSDLDARGTTLYGAYLAGGALGVAGTSIHHKIAHILGGTWNLPHAPLHAMLLPHTVAFAAPAIAGALATVAEAMDVDDVPAALYDLLTRLEIGPALTSAGMPADALDDAVDAIVDAQPTSPRPVERRAIERLLTGALTGTPPAA
jgi:maleylacetate reductase